MPQLMALLNYSRMKICSHEKIIEEHIMKIDWLIICLKMDVVCDARLHVWFSGRWTMVLMVAMDMAMARLMDMDEGDSVLTSLTDVLLTFRPQPLYKSCSGEWEASVAIQYDRSCERSRSHETPSLVLFLMVRLILISSTSSFTPFHVLTCFRPFPIETQ